MSSALDHLGPLEVPGLGIVIGSTLAVGFLMITPGSNLRQRPRGPVSGTELAPGH